MDYSFQVPPVRPTFIFWALIWECLTEKWFSYFSTKTYAENYGQENNLQLYAEFFFI